ncbi:protein kinase [Streptomyces sp. NPDC048172]|uniref:protein kinase domain-containing protein n=1 Tax=Streptomyces sp. NPDC048172 TaxID=3365505 RepID=UPI0037147CFB
MEPLQTGDPRQVGPYRLEGRLGAGGMGQVFLGRSRGGRPVAVKVVRPELAHDEEFRRRLALEVAAARKVGGFYTAQVIEAAPDADPPWMATAYVPGPSLHDAVETHGPLPLRAVTVLAAGLVEGLAAIHACHLVHRDLKPSNVILAEDGPRVIDFGIVRALDAPSLTRSQSVIGTPAFMSPEQAQGREVGPASDVFALGSVLAFSVTGHCPFGTGHPDAVLYRVVHDAPDLSGLPIRLLGTVADCMAKDPARRPTLARLLDEFAVPDRAPAPWLPSPVTTMITERRATTPRLPPPPERTVPRTRQRPALSPVARKLAAEHDVDPSAVKGTGDNGTVHVEDVVAAIKAKHGTYATKAAREFAAENRIDLTKVPGGGKYGLIRIQDVRDPKKGTGSGGDNGDNCLTITALVVGALLLIIVLALESR